MKLQLSSFVLLISLITYATDYHVGLSQPLTTISEVPWATLNAGDRVYIHWRATPYKEKWVINRQGTAQNRIEIIGVNNAQGQQPIIDGNDAVTVNNVNFWNENRGVIKIGGSNVPADGLPTYITIENLEIRSARPAYQFTNDNGQTETYISNAASIYIEKGANIIIRNCTLHDSGNGIFIGANAGQSENILIEKNYIYNNGIVGSYYEHNTYTAAINTTYQFNRFGPLRTGADGNNLKDRSAGLIVKYNWIEGGNRQLDLVDSYDVPEVANHPNYNTTHVYGNILIEPDDAGNSQIIHYGGDSGVTAGYRKGTLYFYNNTVISTRTGNTTLVRLSTNDETAEVFNNVIYTTASGSQFAMIEGSGIFNMHHNWLKTDWQNCFCSPNGIVNDLGNNITGEDPLFGDFDNQLFKPQETSPLVNMGDVIPAILLPDYDISFEYVKHQDAINRPVLGNIDMGAFEYDEDLSIYDETSNNTISIYPNPTSNSFTIVLKNETLQKAIIYNQLGQKIKETILNEVDVSHLNSGLYFLKLTTDKKKVTVRLIKN
ncbi:MAG: T9SS type A sorting domain-containing protein [Flavobacteriaceae bacterium]|nr:T9SS type A sorting domain-containing protein [Flavobacteriaceae bacterium]